MTNWELSPEGEHEYFPPSLFFIHFYEGNLSSVDTTSPWIQEPSGIDCEKEPGYSSSGKRSSKADNALVLLSIIRKEYWWEPILLGNKFECWRFAMAKVEAWKGKDIGCSLISAWASRLFIIMGALKTNQLAIFMEPASWMPRKKICSIFGLLLEQT